MKKFLILLFVFVISLSTFCGCKSDNDDIENAPLTVEFLNKRGNFVYNKTDRDKFIMLLYAPNIAVVIKSHNSEETERDYYSFEISGDKILFSKDGASVGSFTVSSLTQEASGIAHMKVSNSNIKNVENAVYISTN